MSHERVSGLADAAILAIDTSTEPAGVGLLRGTEPLAEIAWSGRSNHSRYLASAVREVLRLGSVAAGELQAVVVASGPGSFNGLRVGISFGKGLSMSLGVRLAGVSTLDVMAAQVGSPGRRVWSLIPAGREELYRGRYRISESGNLARAVYDRLDIAQIAEEYENDVVLAGPGSRLVAERVPDFQSPSGLSIHLEAFSRPLYLAELGRRYLADGGADQVDTLEPLYLRVSSAEERRGGQT